jgi:hypothetical protein
MVNNMSVKDRVSQFEAIAEEDRKEAEKGRILRHGKTVTGLHSLFTSCCDTREATPISLPWK